MNSYDQLSQTCEPPRTRISIFRDFRFHRSSGKWRKRVADLEIFEKSIMKATVLLHFCGANYHVCI